MTHEEMTARLRERRLFLAPHEECEIADRLDRYRELLEAALDQLTSDSLYPRQDGADVAAGIREVLK